MKNGMNRRKEPTFGQRIRVRRRQLDMTQRELARRIKTSTPYVGHLEANKRHPSDQVVSRLAEVLGLDPGELFLLANPDAAELLSPPTLSRSPSAWDTFRRDERLRRLHNITADEMEMLSRVALMGEISSPRDFIYILNTVRHALRRS
jgi:transcriptional regulator with XRE-family HTH domain